MKKIPPFKLVPEPLSEEARRLPTFRWAGDQVGKRHRLGGEPERRVRDEDWPRCPNCQQRLSFYGQLDSMNDDICIADAGMIYIYICFECNEVKAEIDSP
jgi:hypothetical protein